MVINTEIVKFPVMGFLALSGERLKDIGVMKLEHSKFEEGKLILKTVTELDILLTEVDSSFSFRTQFSIQKFILKRLISFRGMQRFLVELESEKFWKNVICLAYVQEVDVEFTF